MHESMGIRGEDSGGYRPGRSRQEHTGVDPNGPDRCGMRATVRAGGHEPVVTGFFEPARYRRPLDGMTDLLVADGSVLVPVRYRWS